MIANMSLAVAVMLSCVIVHYFGLLLILQILGLRSQTLRRRNTLLGRAGMVCSIVFGLMIVHGIEVWGYALIYMAIGAIAPVQDALTFSIGQFTTAGSGLKVAAHWREFAATEAVTGLIMFGWSTAFLIGAMDHMRTFHHHWLDEPEVTPDRT